MRSYDIGPCKQDFFLSAFILRLSSLCFFKPITFILIVYRLLISQFMSPKSLLLTMLITLLYIFEPNCFDDFFNLSMPFKLSSFKKELIFFCLSGSVIISSTSAYSTLKLKLNFFFCLTFIAVILSLCYKCGYRPSHYSIKNKCMALKLS